MGRGQPEGMSHQRGMLMGRGQNPLALMEFEAVILSCSLGVSLCAHSEGSGFKSGPLQVFEARIQCNWIVFGSNVDRRRLATRWAPETGAKQVLAL